MPKVLESVAKLAGLTVSEISTLAERAPRSYRKYAIPKKKGGMRMIFHPAKETKLLQYTILEVLHASLLPHLSAYGFVKGRKSPLRQNAELHSSNPYMIRVDFANFFPSICPEDLFARLESSKNPSKLVLDAEDKIFLRRCLFIQKSYHAFELPIGAPSSPFISNGVMYELDEEILSLSTQNELIYSRYADDLIFSTTQKKSSKMFLKRLRGLLNRTTHPRVMLNAKKTHFMSRNCRCAVTGLVITPEGRITIGRKNKRMIRAFLNLYRNGTLEDKKRSYLQGYLAFLLDVEPSYYNNLCHKYGAEILAKAIQGKSRYILE